MAQQASVKPRILTSGDSALTVEFGSAVSPLINDRVYEFTDTLASAAPPWLVEIVPTYRSLLVQYDPFTATAGEVRTAINALLDLDDERSGNDEPVGRVAKIYELPVA